MIQIYRPKNADYAKNGDMTLMPDYAVVHTELNGSWEAILEHPIDHEGRWALITEESVLKMPSFNGEQLFRIKKTKRNDSGITATAVPIFYDAMDDYWIRDVRPTDKNGQEALDILTGKESAGSIDAPENKYSAVSDIKRKKTAYYEYKNLLEAIAGSDENSFISRWGGEIIYDNYTAVINDKAGTDRGIELRYGKNAAKDGVEEEVNMENVITRIYPKGYNGRIPTYLPDKGEYIFYESPLKDRYATIKKAGIEFDDVKMWGYATEEERKKWEEADSQEKKEELGFIICGTEGELRAALEKKCSEQFEAGLDKPKVTIAVDMIALWGTEWYEEYKELENVSLGDTINIVHDRLGIQTKGRVTELDYDSIRKRVKSVKIGDYQYDYLQQVNTEIALAQKKLSDLGKTVWPGAGEK